MSRPTDHKLYEVLLKALEGVPHDKSGRVGGTGVPNLTISWGYLWPDGTHDMASCSPPSNLTSAQQASIIETQYAAIQTAGGSPAKWVDGYPPNVVSAVATYLNVPVGMPPDWFDTTG